MKRIVVAFGFLLLAGGVAVAQTIYNNNGVGSSMVGGRDTMGQPHTFNTDNYGTIQVTAPPGQPLPVTVGGPGGVTSTQGVGVAGVPDGGVLTIQGVDGGYPIPVSGSFTLTPSGTQNVQGVGTPGAPSGGVVTVQGSTFGTPIPVAGVGPGDGGTVPIVQAPGAPAFVVNGSAQDAGLSATTLCGHSGTLVQGIAGGSASWICNQSGNAFSICLGATPALSCPGAIDAGTTIGTIMVPGRCAAWGGGVSAYCVTLPGQEQIAPDAGTSVTSMY